MAERGEGAAIRFIRDHQNYPHKDWCLIWPFSTTRGYGTFGYLGKGYLLNAYAASDEKRQAELEKNIRRQWADLIGLTGEKV
jgi:hypothetical protein